MNAAEQEMLAGFEKFEIRFCDAMDDDLNTADAIAVLFDFAREINIAVTEKRSGVFLKATLELFTKLCDVLGIVQAEGTGTDDAEIEALVKERAQARAEKNFARADEIRDQLAGMGIVMEDTKDGIKWHRA